MGALTYSKFTRVYRAAAITLCLSMLAACQTTGGSFCQIAKPLRPSASAVDNLSDAEVSQLLAHNQKGRKLCGWKP